MAVEDQQLLHPRPDQGISFTEFSYALLQSQDFAVLNQRLGCTLQIGGNDQWPTGSSFSRIGGSCTNASVSADGTATFDVPASGSCTVLYRVCAPAPKATSAAASRAVYSGPP